MGLVFMVVEYLYRFMRFSLRNHKYVMAFAIVYVTIHLTLVLHSGVPIYPGMHFRDVESVLIFVAALSTIIITHKLFYLISNWRLVKEEFKTSIEVARTIFIRQNSMGLIVPRQFTTQQWKNGMMGLIVPRHFNATQQWMNGMEARGEPRGKINGESEITYTLPSFPC